MTERRLIVMRHAKAQPFAASDRERRLTDRGVQDAAGAGRHLARIGSVPDHAVVSPARRTQETWDEVARESGSGARAQLDEAVYHGNAEALLEALQSVPEQSATVILVGHNPTAAYLCHLLDDGEGDPAAISGMLQGFPTAALAVFGFDGPWAGIGPETGRMLDFHVAGSGD